MYKMVLVVLFFLALIALGPIATIWALNTLFPALAIQFGLATWAAVIVIGTFLRANVTVKRKD
jgi:hypothetical protein